jgi:hypothetical protein
MRVAPFVIFALPRSRTAWLSRFLTYGDWQCGHDELLHARSLEDVKAWLGQPCTGSVETAAAPFWRLLPAYSPEARIVVVRRPVPEVIASLCTVLPYDLPALTRLMRRLDAKLDQIERRMDVLSVRFSDLAIEATCARIFEHCLPYRHDPAWWQSLAPVNIQINLPLQVRQYNAFAPQLEKLAATAKHRIVAGMQREAVELDGVMFQHEPFDRFYEDAKPLFREHLVQTGQSPEDHAGKNLPVLRALDALGVLQTITARSNGRMFGYLMSIVAPSLDSPELTMAEHTLFFASPDMRGLGMKLQRAALASLKARGVNYVVMRAGVRGSGPRLSAIYRRLGAEDFGQLYRLELE